MFAPQFKVSDVGHSHTKRTDNLDGILDRVLFWTEHEFPKIAGYLKNTSNIDNECVRK